MSHDLTVFTAGISTAGMLFGLMLAVANLVKAK
jgi:hypothetical protein